ncbi:MAG: T9SS type A sorting domain-containing protein [Candidatus Marinimicrobia bacterium]|nr:T9SS type A sorting domain-containing protein [Candidatus Neomarinimicrobiota bacterium]
MQIPEEMAINRVYPNPFNASINIEYHMDQFAQGRIVVYDIQGKMIMDQGLHNRAPGTYIWTWNGADKTGQNMPSGAYFVQLIQGEARSETRKIVLIK